MQKTMILAAAVLAGVSVVAEEKALNDWENPAVNSINRMPAATYAVPLADATAVLTDDLEPVTPYKKSLNGDWKIKWVGDPARRPTDFFKPDFDDSDWNTIDVPSCVEMRGYGVPGYTNVRYPHQNLSNPKDGGFATIVDRDTGRADYNPVSSYRTTFTVPEAWKGREVILRFDGVYSAYYVWVNGQKVGYAEDSKLPSEFDVTPYLKEGNNLLAVQVFRWCDGSYLEDQDMFRFSGIFRDVTLWSRPKSGIRDFAVTPMLDGKYENATVSLTLSTYGSVKAPKAEIFDGRQKIAEFGAFAVAGETMTAKAELKGVKLWSAEKPNLYTLVITAGEDIRTKRFGVKEQKIVNGVMLVNGQPVKMKGVNRHETNVDNGRTVSLKDMMDDILLMKKYNVNTVRTCHYPDHHLWYDLCDRLGLYVVAEANVEGHEPGYGDKGLGLFPEWDHTIVERNERQVLFYRNHPSIVFWSMGNETGHGDCFRHAMAKVREIDPTRIIHWERGNVDADVDSTMYPSVEWVEQRGKLGDEKSSKATMKGESDGAGFAASSNSAGKPLFMCEYAHAMGNALGNFQEYWDAIYAHPSLIGGCIWDWVDQAVWKYTGRMDLKTGQQERFLAYGGDFDESPNDGPFCVNGVVDPFRRVSPKLIEVGHVYRNLVVTKADEGFELWNRFCFTDSDEYAGTWSLVEDGVEVGSGEIKMPKLAPLSRGPLELSGLSSILATLDAKKEHFVNVTFTEKVDRPWAKAGWVVSRNQVALTVSVPEEPAEASEKKDVVLAPKMGVEETEDQVTVERARTTAIFDRATGALHALFVRGVCVFDQPIPGVTVGPQLTCMRAMTDNDRWMFQGNTWSENRAKGYLFSGLTQLSYHPGKIRVGENEVTVTVDVTGSKGCGFTHACTYCFNADGSVTLKNKVTPYGKMPVAIPRLGLTMHLPPSLEQMRYYGRGPWENYIDRNTASFVGLYTSTVRDQFQEYVRPQDNGGKSDVRWVEFTDKFGKGVRFSASEPMFMQALHYGREDLEFSRHVNGQRRFRAPLVPREEIILNLDVRQTGLGGASCGPWPMKKYLFDPSAPVEWSMTIEPARR